MKKPNITPELITAAETLMVSMAYTNTVRPIVQGYQQELLDFWQFKVREEWRDRKYVTAKFYENDYVVTDPRDTYMIDDQDAKIYFAELEEKKKEAGFKEPEGYCPLLVAESNERDARKLLIDIASEFTQISHDMLLETYKGYKAIEELTDLILRLCGSYIDSETVLRKYNLKP